MDNVKWLTPLMKQAWCISSILIFMTTQGMILSFITVLLPALRDPNSSIQIDINSGSWLASAIGPSIFIGSISSCFFLNWCGRKNSALIASLPAILGWVMIYLAQSYTVLLIGRILTGVTSGAMYNITLVVIGEFVSPAYRGMFYNLKTALFCLSNTLVHIMGNYMHWRTMVISTLVPHIVAFSICCSWPESPAWLASTKQFEKCEQHFFWLRGVSDESVREVTELIEAQKEILSKLKRNMTMRHKIYNFLNRFTKMNFLKPVCIVCVGFLVMESSGRHVFPSYALQIVGDALNTDTLPYFYTLGIDIVITVSSLLSSLLIRFMNQRTVLFTTGFASLTVLILTSIYIFLTSEGIVSKDHPWIIMGLFLTFFSLTNLGTGPIPMALQGELIPLEHKEVGVAVVGTFLSILLMSTLKVFPYMLISVKIYGAFAVFGVVMGISLLILYFQLPETKDRTLQEIENYFNYGRFRIKEIKSDDQVLLKMANEEKA